MSKPLPSAEELAEQVVAQIRRHPLECASCESAVAGVIRADRNAVLEAAAEVADKLLDDARNPWEISREILALKEKP